MTTKPSSIPAEQAQEIRRRTRIAATGQEAQESRAPRVACVVFDLEPRAALDPSQQQACAALGGLALMFDPLRSTQAADRVRADQQRRRCAGDDSRCRTRNARAGPQARCCRLERKR